jgi:signal transduction histidine kinase
MRKNGRGTSPPSTVDTFRAVANPPDSTHQQKITVSRLSPDDFRLLVHSSSAAIACFELLHPLDRRNGTTDFVSALFERESVCMEANAVFLEMLQERSVENILGASIGELLPKNRNWPKLFSTWHQASLSPAPIELGLRRQDGTTWSASCALYGIHEGPYVRRIWLIARDISKQISTLRALIDVEGYYRSILNAPNMISIRYLPCGLCEYMSPATTCALGFMEGDRFEQPIYVQDFVHPADIQTLLAPSSRDVDAWRSEQVALRCRKRDGRFTVFNAQIFKVPSADPSVVVYDLVGQLTNNAAGNPLLGDHLSQTSACLIHDLNNLISAAIAQTMLTSSECGADNISAIQRTLELCANLLKRVATLTEQRPEPLSVISLSQSVNQCVALMRPLIGSAIALSIGRLPDIPLLVSATESDIAQIVSNLILNAQDALGNSGKIHVTIDQTAGNASNSSFATLTITDNGPGIDPSILPHLFQQRASSKLNPIRHGLGLISVKTTLDRLGGEISVASTPSGTTFRVCLPLITAPTAGNGPALIGPDSTLSIVIADDEPLIRDMFKNILSGMGHTITTAPDGRALLKTLETTSDVDVVILDDQMPCSRAPDLASQLLFQRPGLSIIVASGDPSLRARMRSVATNISFLDKPFTRSDIEAALSAIPKKRPAFE